MMNINSEIKKEASELISWKEKKRDEQLESHIQNAKQSETIADGFLLLQEEKNKHPLTYEEIVSRRVQVVGVGELNAESGKWEAEFNQAGDVGLVTDDFDIVFEKIYINHERDENRDWQKYLEDARSQEIERRKLKYDGVETLSVVTPEVYYLTQDGKIEMDFVAYQVRFGENDEKQVRYTPMGYDRLPPDIKEGMEAEFGSRENIVGKWIPNSEEMIEKHDAFVNYTLNDEGHATWEEYRDAKLGKKEEMVLGNVSDVDEISTPNSTPAIIKVDAEVSK